MNMNELQAMQFLGNSIHNWGVKWTPEEDQRLLRGIELFGERDWKSVSELVGTRSSVKCIQRWEKVLRPDLVKGKWTEEEDNLLKDIVMRGFEHWGKVAEEMNGRTSKQCRERWANYLDPTLIKTPFSTAEDEAVLRLQSEFGNKWAYIARLLPGRTENSVKLRYHSLVRTYGGRTGINFRKTMNMMILANESMPNAYSIMSDEVLHPAKRPHLMNQFTEDFITKQSLLNPSSVLNNVTSNNSISNPNTSGINNNVSMSVEDQMLFLHQQQQQQQNMQRIQQLQVNQQLNQQHNQYGYLLPTNQIPVTAAVVANQMQQHQNLIKSQNNSQLHNIQLQQLQLQQKLLHNKQQQDMLYASTNGMINSYPNPQYPYNMHIPPTSTTSSTLMPQQQSQLLYGYPMNNQQMSSSQVLAPSSQTKDNSLNHDAILSSFSVGQHQNHHHLSTYPPYPHHYGQQPNNMNYTQTQASQAQFQQDLSSLQYEASLTKQQQQQQNRSQQQPQHQQEKVKNDHSDQKQPQHHGLTGFTMQDIDNFIQQTSAIQKHEATIDQPPVVAVDNKLETTE